ncbi:hypothetical protein [Petrotoga sp. 9PW.55.5.1]|nr:hypothetical protein [Petrotoga sp. 9PW.55.5.1]
MPIRLINRFSMHGTAPFCKEAEQMEVLDYYIEDIKYRIETCQAKEI